jgi:hypothetical protein
VFVIIESTSDAGKDGPAFWTINGASWPDTERLNLHGRRSRALAQDQPRPQHRHQPKQLHGHTSPWTAAATSWSIGPVRSGRDSRLAVTQVLDAAKRWRVRRGRRRPSPATGLYPLPTLAVPVTPKNRAQRREQWNVTITPSCPLRPAHGPVSYSACTYCQQRLSGGQAAENSQAPAAGWHSAIGDRSGAA